MKIRQAKNGSFFIKKGMTSVMLDNGNIVPVTVLEQIKNNILGKKDNKSLCIFHGYHGRFNKPQMEMFSKNYSFGKSFSENSDSGDGNNENNPKKGFIREIEFSGKFLEKIKENPENKFPEITLDFFEENTFVDVSAFSKGKGFQGGMKRHGFSGQPASHGCSVSHRALGSTGNRHLPAKTIKGRKMPGHMGHELTTQQNLKIMKVIKEYNVILVKGSIPGPKKTLVFARMAVKNGK